MSESVRTPIFVHVGASTECPICGESVGVAVDAAELPDDMTLIEIVDIVNPVLMGKCEEHASDHQKRSQARWN